jgi:tetratricopeptide (TPR) repeat protein
MRRALMILVVGLSFLFPAFVWAEIYKWVDEKGTAHFSEDPGTIPERQTEKRQSTTTGTILGNSSNQLKEDERITYYYRNPRSNELIRILESILREEDSISNSKTFIPLIHFFATALQKDLNKVKDLENLQPNYSGEAGRLLQALIKEVRNYHPADLKSPEDLELLWFEYKASGNKEIIERLIKVVIATIPSKANNLQIAVIESLIENAPYHSEVYGMLRKRAESLVGEVVNIIRYSAFDPASEHVNRGLNLYNEGKYEEAMQEYKKSLSYVPDHCDAYIDIANIYDIQRNFWEAIKVGKKAISIEPDSPLALYNLALYYQHLNEQDEAIKWYQKCIECDPKEIDCHYGLGVAYKSKQDKDKAAFHFRKYLEYAPNGKQAPYVKQHLASIGQTVKEDPTNVVIMLQNKRYDILEKHLLSFLRERNRDKNGQFLLNLAYQKLCGVEESQNSYAKRLFQLNAWLTYQNSSHFANACLGIIYINYAWYARGSGFANTITEEGGRLFEERLLTAKDYLEKAYSLDQSDPNVPAWLITVAMGLGLEREEMEKQFKRAILADPTDHQAYFSKLMYLMPKWLGSKEEMFLFARDSAKKAPPGSRISGVLLTAHWEMYFRSGENRSYFRDPNIWKEMKEVYQTLTKSFPEAKTTHNWFARTAYLAGDYEVARRELKIIGDDWDKNAWGNKIAFEEVKRELSARR